MLHRPFDLLAAMLLGLPLLAACSGQATTPGEDFVRASDDLECSIPSAEIFNGGPGKDGIPALNNPRLVGVREPGTEYLRPTDRVIGLDLDGQPIAVPLNVQWWHEIVNLTVDSFSVAITHCPLTGSSLVFDRRPLGGVQFGVSGLLYQNNLLMYDRSSGESLWPQMERGARCGPATGKALRMVPAIEMRWDAWRDRHPNGRVVSPLGTDRDYRLYPYGNYDQPDNPALLFPLRSGIDTRRPPKERVLGVPAAGGGGIAFPFGELEGSGAAHAVVPKTAGGEAIVVFWDAAARAAMAYRPTLDGRPLTFRATASGIVDDETGSRWSVEGAAVEGPLRFRQLAPVAEAYVAYWFAWAAFHPSTTVWSRS